MAPRRKAPRRRAKKSFTINAIEAGVALSLMQSANVASAVDSALKGNLKGSLSAIESGVQSNKTRILGTLASGAVAKMLAKSFAVGQVAKLGPVKVRV
jgi:hypothetical protein